jgi:hypothetical protein
MIYKISADLILLIHFSWILFTLFGCLIAYPYFWLKRIHWGMLLYGLLIEIFGWICPLTYLENWFLRQSNPSSAYQGDFLSHYLSKIIYLNLSRSWLILGAIMVVTLNLWFYVKERP